jgi:hypothetical protein
MPATRYTPAQVPVEYRFLNMMNIMEEFFPNSRDVMEFASLQFLVGAN